MLIANLDVIILHHIIVFQIYTAVALELLSAKDNGFNKLFRLEQWVARIPTVKLYAVLLINIFLYIMK
jgi:hypothetical protein